MCAAFRGSLPKRVATKRLAQLALDAEGREQQGRRVTGELDELGNGDDTFRPLPKVDALQLLQRLVEVIVVCRVGTVDVTEDAFELRHLW